MDTSLNSIYQYNHVKLHGLFSWYYLTKVHLMKINLSINSITEHTGTLTLDNSYILMFTWVTFTWTRILELKKIKCDNKEELCSNQKYSSGSLKDFYSYRRSSTNCLAGKHILDSSPRPARRRCARRRASRGLESDFWFFGFVLSFLGAAYKRGGGGKYYVRWIIRP